VSDIRGRELRRKLWELADRWERQAADPMVGINTAHTLRECASQLRGALTYPLATEADEQELQRTYGKSSEQLADEAEKDTLCRLCSKPIVLVRTTNPDTKQVFTFWAHADAMAGTAVETHKAEVNL
jgi:hypothetical protein